jgi:hypothetical protein
LAAEGTFEVIAVATGFLFRFRLMRIGIAMFPTHVGVVTRIEAVSFGAALAVRLPMLSYGVALHAAFLGVSPAIPLTVVRDGPRRRPPFCSPHTTSVPLCLGDLERVLAPPASRNGRA